MATPLKRTEKKPGKASRTVKTARPAPARRRIWPWVLAAFLGIGAAGLGWLFTHPFQLRATTLLIPYKSDFTPQDNIAYVFPGSVDEVKIAGKVDTEKPGDYELIYNYKGEKITVPVTVADTTPPALFLQNAASDTNTEVRPENFVKEVSDDSKVTLSFGEGTDVSRLGTYTVEITATDAYGNTTSGFAQYTREEDKEEPVITGLSEDYEIWQGAPVKADSGLKVSDNLDPKPVVTLNTSGVKVDTPGQYELLYTVTDKSGNKAETSQTVTVKKNPEYKSKAVYLTFDGSPSRNTETILKILDYYKIKATFFVDGEDAKYDDVLKAIVKQGSSIGLLANNPENRDIYTSSEAYYEDVARLRAKVKKITGQAPSLIRFPDGDGGDTAELATILLNDLEEEAASRGYTYLEWNTDSGDSAGNNTATATIVDNSTGSEEEMVVILLHDGEGRATTVDALPQIIESYQKRGYKFFPVTERTPRLENREAENNESEGY